MNEEAKIRIGPQRHRKKETKQAMKRIRATIVTVEKQ
jgi:hypothetical protein